MRKGLWLFLGATLVALAETSWAQRASHWRVYRMADGLPEPACLSVTIAPQGNVLARHLDSDSVTELDGYSVKLIPAPNPGRSRVYESPGGQLWTAVAEGLEESRNGAWELYPVPAIVGHFGANVPSLIDPVPLYPVRQGLVIFLLPDRLCEFSSENPDRSRRTVLRTAAQTQLGRFYSMAVARDGGLWVSGARGLAKVPGPLRNLKPEIPWLDHIVPGTLEVQNLQQPQENEDGSVTAMAESTKGPQRLLVRFDGQHWSAQSPGIEKVRHLWGGLDGTCWATTIDSLFEWGGGRPETVENEEISTRQFFDVAVEPGGAFWLATANGLFRYTPLLWRSPAPVQRTSLAVVCLASDQAARLWFIAGKELHFLEENHHASYPLPERALPAEEAAVALFPIKDGTVVLGAGGRWEQFQPTSGMFRAFPSAERNGRTKAIGLLKDGRLCLARLEASPSGIDGALHLEAYDGRRFVPLPSPPAGLFPGTNVLAVLEAQNGDLWLSTDRAAAWLHDQKWRAFTTADKTTPEAAVGFAELSDGRIWCATPDKVWRFDGREWSLVRGGFDRITGMLRSRDGSVWVASGSGLHRFAQGAWVENGPEEGLPGANIRAISEDQRGRLWAGTARGVSLLHPEADPDPPDTTIEPLTDREKRIPEGEAITLAFNGQDKWKYTPRERLLYSHRLDEGEWSPFSEIDHASFADLHAGKHYFQVRAMDRNCNVDPSPARLEFAVVLPWYKERRLVLISFAGAAGALFFAGLAFNRHRRLLRSYAEVERKIADRTRELELASRELVHSQKMNALGTIAAGIAHDFNNILSIIKGSTQIIEENLDNPQKVRTRLDRIQTVVEQGAGIVKAMLGFSRDTGQEPALCDLNVIVEDTLKLLGDRFLREVQVTFEPAPGLPTVRAAKDLIQQILLNFIFNAAESMTGRKQVIIATRRVEHLPASPVLTPSPAPAYLAVSVRDFGCGIPPENLPRIFEPFFTTKALSARRGTGLGLSMVYELARKMAAGLAVESAVNQGSTFTLILPVREVPKSDHQP